MNVFSSPHKRPFFAVLLSSKLMLSDLTYRIMADKMLELASNQSGFLGAEYGSGELDLLITYWQTRETAEAWLNHDTQRRILSVGEKFWYEEYALTLFDALKTSSFSSAQEAVHSSRFPRIVTPRGVLTLLNDAQAPLLHDYLNQEKGFLAPWEPLRSNAYYSLETCQLRIREMRRDFLEDKGLVFCFLSPNEDRMLAYSNYSNIIRGVFQACNLGYSLRQGVQGCGLMSEALSAGIRYIHKDMNIDRIQASYMPRNARSAAVLSKLGFDKEGLAKQYLKINGQWEDHVLTALVLR
ncbi:GNAT family N-acetyltransferase [Marinomonas sp. IMCC 4694]|uniref:GNAT family N-acetyltransferase n=1 Tax=Marinomonas sp. IMCC 4694 TaxID=2605432 RepID=UPI0011E7176A|nr:GNAT family N-acetyltransferase [Marinomonas sp. IMCC 4694]TYL48192.1 GNAT family N-acetyltransferase [Marinomonas sp. IMCC 4694]